MPGGCAVMLGGWNQHLAGTGARPGPAGSVCRPAEEKEGKHSFSDTAPPRGDLRLAQLSALREEKADPSQSTSAYTGVSMNPA